MENIKQKIIQKFNNHLGSNLKNLEGIYDFQECLKTEKDEIEKSVNIHQQSSIIFDNKCHILMPINYFSPIVIDGIKHCSF